ncbi:SGNH/GDSL hydrolase family protein [Fodinibius sp.]|uniref:SGNH/GDSL hydrolase family protein n=1 Tax=Fodinibius sp. TaxID=1872440 RepID=UPI002ACEE429|nr:SGNH/GDSL hydrolase family protein [Fodinibius sp.]MDZ7659330.1 SGNH/GDSL hydrolase family protein [Fodinibius sp.]
MIIKHIRLLCYFVILLSTVLLSGCQEKSKSTVSDQEITYQEISFLALGDSYTIGESVDEEERWPVQLADSLRQHGYSVSPPDIIAETGWTTADLQQAIDEENPQSNYDLVSLLIGVNNQYQGLNFEQFEQEFEELLSQAITFAGDDTADVFVVSIPNYGATPFGQIRNPEQIRQELKQYNETAESIAQEYEITFIDITPISEKALDNPELTASDDLHPSGKMYQLWVSKMLPSILPKLQ